MPRKSQPSPLLDLMQIAETQQLRAAGWREVREYGRVYWQTPEGRGRLTFEEALLALQRQQAGQAKVPPPGPHGPCVAWVKWRVSVVQAGSPAWEEVARGQDAEDCRAQARIWWRHRLTPEQQRLIERTVILPQGEEPLGGAGTPAWVRRN